MGREWKIGRNQERILRLLLDVGVLALTASPRTYFRVLGALSRDLRRLRADALRSAIRKLYASRLIAARDHPDGRVELVLTDRGRRRALTYRLDELVVPRPQRWDRKWRLVVFDVPEKLRDARDALRGHLVRMGCHELQRSVLIHPYDCRDQVDFLVEFYHLRRFVRFLIVESIDSELHLKTLFRL